MIAAWMLYAAAAGLLLAAAAAGVDRLLRLLGRPTRWTWAAAMLLSLALPPLAWWQGATTARDTAARATTARAVAERTPDPARDARLDALLARATLVVAPTEALARLDRPLLAAWALLSLGVLGWLGAAQRRLRRVRREWRPAVVEDVPVLVAGRTGPAVAGVLRPAVVLPEWALAGDRTLLRLMLAHEREHLRAADPRLLAAAAVAVALAPWNLALWYQLRRLRLAVEIDCDRRVLRRHPDVRRYGALLLEVGRRAPRTPALPVAALAAGPTSLEWRIRTMTMRRPRHPLLQGLALAATSALAAAGALVVPQPAVATLGAQEVERSLPRKTDDRVERVRRIVAEAMPELLGQATGMQVVIAVVVGEEGEVVRADYEHSPLPGVAVDERRDAVRIMQPAVLRDLDPAAIASIEILKLAAGDVSTDRASVVWVQLVGDEEREARAAGAVRLRTESPARVPEGAVREAGSRARTVLERQAAERATAGESRVKLRLPSTGADDPLYVLDGVILSPESVELVRDLDPATIESIEVVKGAAAERRYGARGAKGVIQITTKPAPPPAS